MGLAVNIILVILLGLALYFDLTVKKIPNFLTFPAMILGLAAYTLLEGLGGFLFSLYGLLLGTGIFLIFFVMGVMGGGDVKLLGAVGALTGAQFVLYAALLTAVFGGVMAVIYLLITGRLLKTLKQIAGFVLTPLFTALYRLQPWPFFNRASVFFSPGPVEAGEKPSYLPYGAAIAAGTLAVLIWSAAGEGPAFLPWQL